MIQVPLSGLAGAGRFALIDNADFELVSRYTWHYRDGYALTKAIWKGKKREVRMHRLIADCDDSHVIIDHKNRNRLDNQRHNLRWYTPTQNANNRETSRHIIAFGERKTIGEWAADPRCGCSYNILRKRLDKFVEPELAILAADSV